MPNRSRQQPASLPDDYWEIFREQNPWRDGKDVPEVLALPSQRPLAEVLWKRLISNEPNRFQLILGPRRVGKTTAMYQTVKNLLGAGIAGDRLWWLRLDHPALMKTPVGNVIKSLLKSDNATTANPIFLFLDELTYGENWDLWLKTFYDEKWPLRIVGSSSATAAIRIRRQESGVGRWEEQHLTPYLFSEYLSLVGRKIPVRVQENLSDTLAAAISSRINISDLADLRRKFTLIG
ncbi:MAG: AAA family ATPase, partial [Tepidisphaeraceae bacterium]